MRVQETDVDRKRCTSIRSTVDVGKSNLPVLSCRASLSRGKRLLLRPASPISTVSQRCREAGILPAELSPLGSHTVHSHAIPPEPAPGQSAQLDGAKHITGDLFHPSAVHKVRLKDDV
jgi:hypothetical protein